MPVWQINITTNPNGGPTKPARFEFADPPPQVQAGDQVFWSNNDSQPHHPVPDDPSQSGITEFMPTQIAAHASSPTFAFGKAGTVGYHCLLHKDETGSIDVGAAPVPQA